MYNQYAYQEPQKIVDAPAIGPLSMYKTQGQGSSMQGLTQYGGGLAAPWGNGTTYQQFSNSNQANKALDTTNQFGGYWTSQKDKQSWDPNYISPTEVAYFLQYQNGMYQTRPQVSALAKNRSVNQFNQDLMKYHLETGPDGVQRYVLDNTALSEQARNIRAFMINGANPQGQGGGGMSSADATALANQSAQNALASYLKMQQDAQTKQAQQTAQQQEYLRQYQQVKQQALLKQFGYDQGASIG